MTLCRPGAENASSYNAFPPFSTDTRRYRPGAHQQTLPLTKGPFDEGAPIACNAIDRNHLKNRDQQQHADLRVTSDEGRLRHLVL